MRRTLTLHDGRRLSTLYPMPDAVIREAVRYAYDDGHGAYAAGQRYGVHSSTIQGWNRRAIATERVREQVQTGEMRRLQLLLSVEDVSEQKPRHHIAQYDRAMHPAGYSSRSGGRIGRVTKKMRAL